MIQGGVECGPNAVLAFAREGYRKTDMNLGDLCETLAFRGFRKLAMKYWRMGAGEMWRSWSKAAFVRALQHLIPEIRGEQLVPARAGVRAMAVAPDGAMVDDFVIQPKRAGRERAQCSVARGYVVAEYRQAGGGEAGGAAWVSRWIRRLPGRYRLPVASRNII